MASSSFSFGKTGQRLQQVLCTPVIFASLFLSLAFLVRNHVDHPMPYVFVCVVVASMVNMMFWIAAWGNLSGRPTDPKA